MTFRPRKIILVAEDQILVRREATDALTDAGYEVIEAGDADDALTTLEARAEDIRLLFTDIQMPGSIHGLQLANHVRRRWPRIGLLITSGATPRAADLPPGSRFMSKAYDPSDMAAHVRALLSAG
jgi:CheY-like chemotaxis protein